MLTAVQGVIQDNSILINDDIRPYNGRIVTVIINEDISADTKQDKQAFFGAVGKIDIDKDAVKELRASSMI